MHHNYYFKHMFVVIITSLTQLIISEPYDHVRSVEHEREEAPDILQSYL